MGEVMIKARANGPYRVEGPVRVIDAQGNEFVPATCGDAYRALSLRALGHEAVLLDNRHRRVGFVSDDVAPRVSV